MVNQLENLEPSSERYRVLATAIDFKRSWLELAEHLTKIERTGEFKAWGYRTFGAYATHELHLRRDTVTKLTRSYSFLEEHEPARLYAARAERERPIPAFEVLDALALARANPELPEDVYRELRQQVFGEGMTPAQVRAAAKPKTKAPEREDPLARIVAALKLAERLYGLVLEADELPEAIAKDAERVVQGLRALVEA
jgi:hypothetical protein